MPKIWCLGFTWVKWLHTGTCTISHISRSHTCLTFKHVIIIHEWWDNLICLNAEHSLASLINLLGVFRRGCCICGCQKDKGQHGFSLTYSSRLLLFLHLFSMLFTIKSELQFLPACAYEFRESLHAWDAALLSASDCSWSPAIKHKWYY